MPAVAPLELSPEEQAFFDAGDSIDQSPPSPPGERTSRHRSRRHHHRPWWQRRLRKLRGASWLKATKTTLLVIAAVWAGYRMSIMVIDRGLPDPTELSK
jgi:hypothetical protein